MQFRTLVRQSAVLLAVCCASNGVAAMAHDHDTAAKPADPHFVPFLNAVRAQSERDAREAMIGKLRQLRDDLRNYALIARGGKMTDEQRAAGNVLKAIKDNTAALLSKAPGTNVDPQDNSQLDPLLFELGSN